MSLCCCGKIKFRKKQVDNGKTGSKSDNEIVQNKEPERTNPTQPVNDDHNHNNSRNDNNTNDNKSSSNSDNNNNNDNNSNSKPNKIFDKQLSKESTKSESIPVVMRPEAVRKKMVFSEQDIKISDDNSNRSGTDFQNSRTSLLKSVFHKSIRFDEQTIDPVAKKPNRFQKPFVAASRRGSLYIFRTQDDVIITPFAQILASLRKIRANFMLITNNPKDNDEKNAESTNEQVEKDSTERENEESNGNIPETDQKLAKETLKELEWCLERLENVQTTRSVSDMASAKFKQIINRELSQFSDGSKGGHQVSDYICKTFLDNPIDESIPEAASYEQDLHETDIPKSSPKLLKAHTEPILNNVRLCSEPLIRENEDVEGESEGTLTDEKLPLLGVEVPNPKLVTEILNRDLSKWGMELFDFTRICVGQTLTVISFAIFQQLNLFNKFQISPAVFVQFLVNVERSYKTTVPYHNSIHAADVTQSANVLLGGPALENVFSDLEILSVIFACIVHDMDHPGVTNQYLINTNNQLATLYNDNSVLENHHLAMAFSLLANKECDFLTSLSRRHRQTMRRMVIDMVLATDMSKHMTLLADLKTMVETKKVAGSGILTLDTYQDRIQILQNLVHCADLSNPTKPLAIYQVWTDRIMEEFFLQGDKERDQELEISPMCDRQTASIEKSQVSFIDFIVHPLWETWSELVYPDTQGILDTLEENREWYFKKSQENAATVKN